MAPKSRPETIINFPVGAEEMDFYTCDENLQDVLRSLGIRPERNRKDDDGGLSYVVPRKYLLVGKPTEFLVQNDSKAEKSVAKTEKHSEVLSEREQRRAARREAREERKGGKSSTPAVKASAPVEEEEDVVIVRRNKPSVSAAEEKKARAKK